ncbi:hypothetical protein [Paenibacillus lutimineralis]|uniref:DnaD domain protein n=1 Tax=Paenibacillus lutimineralis TaxID=2707005 RepID=A0A3Q9IC75_9BACL|nr:hypothetical protein [Paenibacillus lutimineralis]AZS17411.1 hypothetical protein EI981_25300 [Paenibacillus lutimineralis]
MKGWIRLHRKVRDNPVFNDLQLFRLWTICLTEAAHKSYEQPVGRQVVSLEPGQFVTGRFDLHDLYNRGLKRSDKVAAEFTVWRWLQSLEKQGLVSIKSSNKFSIVTVVNWAFYQGDEQINEQQNEQELSIKLATNEQELSIKLATNEQELSTNKNVKNLENEKNDKKNKSTSRNKKPTYPEDSPYFKMAVYLKGKIDSMTASEGLASLTDKANLQSWADDFRKLVELDKQVDKKLIQEVMDWFTSDNFWKRNVLSGEKFRKHFAKMVLDMRNKSAGSKRTGNVNGGKPKPEIVPRSDTDDKVPTDEEFAEMIELAERMQGKKRGDSRV